MISATTTLVLMPCSATKLQQPAPARELYRGPLWQTLRTHRGALAWRNVVVLSGKHGLLGAEETIAPYEQRLSPAAADRMIEELPSALIAWPAQAFRTVICAGAGDYKRVFAALVADLSDRGMVAADAELRQVNGGIGEQRGQLGAWLREIAA